MMYYWHIMHLNKNELLFKFYLAQKLKPSKNDWVIQIGKDKKDLRMQLDDEEVMRMPKHKFKEILQNQLNAFVANYFLAIQSKQTKTKHLKITNKFKFRA